MLGVPGSGHQAQKHLGHRSGKSLALTGTVSGMRVCELYETRVTVASGRRQGVYRSHYECVYVQEVWDVRTREWMEGLRGWGATLGRQGVLCAALVGGGQAGGRAAVIE